ncbi:MAG: glycine cleavage system protein GcvH [Deltaproteobacteria bacterium]|nr:glycine cleavage system protein GcvH [Deltaproteobacteria bacterium]
MSENVPSDLLYTREHEWARIDGKIATVGITRFAVDQLGDITQVDLPREGENVRKDDVFGTVESVKAVSDLFSPLTGKVIKVNTPLPDTPEYLNDDPYDEGWLIQIEIANPDEATKLMNADQYVEFIKEQEAE